MIRALTGIRVAVGPDFCLMLAFVATQTSSRRSVWERGRNAGPRAAGEYGVASVITILEKEVSISLALVGKLCEN